MLACQSLGVRTVSKLYEFYPDNYDGTYTSLEIIALYGALLRSCDALIAINYNNIGVILVSETGVKRYLVYPDSYDMKYERQCPLFHKVRYAGTLKAPVYSLACSQPMMYVCIFNIDGKFYAATRFGVLEADSLLEVAEPTTEGYAEMFQDNGEEVYGICKIEGKRCAIVKEGNKLKVR